MIGGKQDAPCVSKCTNQTLSQNSLVCFVPIFAFLKTFLFLPEKVWHDVLARNKHRLQTTLHLMTDTLPTHGGHKLAFHLLFVVLFVSLLLCLHICIPPFSFPRTMNIHGAAAVGVDGSYLDFIFKFVFIVQSAILGGGVAI